MNTPHINIQNVYEWLRENAPYEIDTVIVPPWDHACYYFRTQGNCMVDVGVDDDSERIESFGYDHDVRWIVDYDIHLKDKSNDYVELATLTQGITNEGLSGGNEFLFLSDYAQQSIKQMPEPMGKTFPDWLKHHAGVCMLANSFAHCKNVELIDQPLTRQQRRLKERKGGTFYKILAIEPFKRQVRSEVAASGESEIKRALHIARGHFRTYTEERPLFGKHAGTYWIPMHTRGSKKHGVVEKDYRIDL